MVELNTILIAGGAVGLTVCATPILLGLGASGVVAGSVAAGVQSGIGNVVAGSAFSTLTSLAMKGIFVKGLAGGAISVAAGFATRFKQ